MVPGKSLTTTQLFFSRVLTSVDFPTFGLPITDILIGFLFLKFYELIDSLFTILLLFIGLGRVRVYNGLI